MRRELIDWRDKILFSIFAGLWGSEIIAMVFAYAYDDTLVLLTSGIGAIFGTWIIMEVLRG